MDDLQAWLRRQIDEHLGEPSSGLGEAINYLLKRWDKFTLFLRQAGAPLDNNLCERALKKVILHRKNAMFYKTLGVCRERAEIEPRSPAFGRRFLIHFRTKTQTGNLIVAKGKI